MTVPVQGGARGRSRDVKTHPALLPRKSSRYPWRKPQCARPSVPCLESPAVRPSMRCVSSIHAAGRAVGPLGRPDETHRGESDRGGHDRDCRVHRIASAVDSRTQGRGRSPEARGLQSAAAGQACSTSTHVCATLERMKAFIHARLREADRAMIERLKQSTGRTESEIVRRGLHLVAAEERQHRSALVLAGSSVGRFKKGPKDLSTSKKHLEGFGE